MRTVDGIGLAPFCSGGSAVAASATVSLAFMNHSIVSKPHGLPQFAVGVTSGICS